eukprot:GHVN01025302.1.p1 GENE.GHVN01025302.1~~GHVN01025302.1.p1  ORF type:complete len:494 (+),score=94.73 GHVN01025302.1:97-1578(+)
MGRSRSPILLGLLIGLSLTSLISPVYGQVKVLSPAQLASHIKQTTPEGVIPGATSTFGAPTYGEKLIGQIFYQASKSSHCDVGYIEEIKKQVAAAEKIGHSSSSSSPSKNKIYLLDRGVCTFVTKARIAQQGGADGVVFIDDGSSHWDREKIQRIIIADDGSGKDVMIPSVLLSQEDGNQLKHATETSAVVVELEWNFPSKEKVSVDFWTDSGSRAGSQFLREYAPFAEALQGHLLFLTHYNVFELQTDYNDMCLPGDSMFCADAPEGVNTVTGRDVLEEDVRQVCIWQSTAKAVNGLEGSLYSKSWWEYITHFYDSCHIEHGGQDKHGFSKLCSHAAMKAVGIKVDDVEDCVSNKEKVILAEEKQNRAWSTLAIRINGVRFSGTPDALLVTKAVCSAFADQPKECYHILSTNGQSVVREGTSGFAAFMFLLFVAGLIAALYMYQKHIRTTMQRALREEVMVEVKTQMQEYHQLEGDDGHGEERRQQRPLMLT